VANRVGTTGIPPVTGPEGEVVSAALRRGGFWVVARRWIGIFPHFSSEPGGTGPPEALVEQYGSALVLPADGDADARRTGR
jgi:hypothetical protein